MFGAGARSGSPSMSTDAAGFACAADRSVASTTVVFVAALRPGPFQTRPPACYRLPGDYPDPTCTGRRRRAYEQKTNHDLTNSVIFCSAAHRN